MPPCGYRSAAVNGVVGFLNDNLDYFFDLYAGTGLSVYEAIEVEFREIDAIQAGRRGDAWAKAAVVLNRQFYETLRSRTGLSWENVKDEGREIVWDADRSLNQLGHVRVAKSAAA